MAEFNQTISVEDEDGHANYVIGTGPVADFDKRLYGGEAGFFRVERKTGSNTMKWGGTRFTNVTIAQGATINSATITLTHADAGASFGSLFCDAHDVDDCPAFSASLTPHLNWTPTTASATISVTSPSAGDTAVWTVTAIVQELVDRGSWASGNAMGFRYGHSTPASYTYSTVFFADVGHATYTPAQLYINYTEGIDYPILVPRHTWYW